MASFSTSLAPYHVFGLNPCIRKHVFPVHHDILLYIAGRYLVKLNIETGQRVFAFNHHERQKAYSCLTVHEQTVYISEMGHDCSILLCNLKDLNVVGKLEARSNVGYNCLDVRNDGRLLCGVTIDGHLTLWDLCKMQIVTQTKACDENVLHGAFSLCDENMIMTAGTNHLKMWRVEETFTGLKLKGKHWKFGDTDVCNIPCYIQLQNGEILTGTESGLLLLWIESRIKYIFSLHENDDTNDVDKTASDRLIPLHDGGVSCLHYDKKRHEIITGGADGMLKWWKSDSILLCHVASPPHNSKSKYLKLIAEKVMTLHQQCVHKIEFARPSGDDGMIVKDNVGKLFKLNLVDKSAVTYVDFHQGEISGMDISPTEHICVTGGKDKKICCFQYVQKKILSSILLSSECTCITWCPISVDRLATRTFVVGFADGGLQIMQLVNDRIELIESFQPYDSRIEVIKFHSTHCTFACCDDSGKIFLFEYNITDNARINPLPVGFIECKGMLKSSFWWKEDEFTLQYFSDNGKLYSADLRCVLGARNLSKRTTYKLDTPLTQEEVTQNPHSNSIGSSSFKETLCKDSFDGQFVLETGPVGIVKIWQSGIDSNNLRKSTNQQPNLRVFGVEESFTHILHTDNRVEKSATFPGSCTENLTLEQELKQQQTKSKQQIISKQKKRLRDTVSRMRTEMLSVRQLNSNLMPHIRLTQSEFFLHSFFTSVYEKLMQKELKKINANNHDFIKNIGERRHTLQETFLNCLDDDFVNTSSFQRSHEVRCVPIMKRNTFLMKLKEIKKRTKMYNYGRKSDYTPLSDEIKAFKKDRDNSPKESFQSEQLHRTAMNRKEMRKKRNEMIARKAAEYNSLQSIQTIDDNSQEKKMHIDCAQEKLLDDFGVPMKAQMNVEDKITDILICEESIYDSKKTFNAKVKRLYMKRLSILEDDNDRNLRVKEIQSELDTMLSPLCYKVGLQIDSTSVLPQLVQFFSCCIRQEVASRFRLDDEMKANEILLEHEKSKLSSESSNSFESFDIEIWVTLLDYFDIIFTTKLEEVRLSNLFLELNMLLGFEDRGKELQRHLEYQHSNYIEIVETLNMCEGKLAKNTEGCHSVSEEKERIMQEFDILVPNTNQNRDDLFKIFMRGKNDKIAEFLDVDSFDESFLYESEEEDMCPDTCPSHLFKDVLNLREKRNSNDNENKRLLIDREKLRSNYDLFHSKLKQSEKLVKEFRDRIQKFEKSKQNAVNDTIVTTTLSTTQMYLWDDDHQINAIPNSQTKFLILSTQHLMQLIKRYWETADQVKACRKELIELNSEVKKKSKNNRDLEEIISIEKRKCDELQLLKFGQKVDIDGLDKLSEKIISSNCNNNSVIEQLERNLRKKEAQIRSAELTNTKRRQELKAILHKNTEVLNLIAESSHHHMSLSKEAEVFPKSGDDISSDGCRQQNITDDLVQLKMASLRQRKEIDMLKKDIACLRRKDGYIYGRD